MRFRKLSSPKGRPVRVYMRSGAIVSSDAALACNVFFHASAGIRSNHQPKSSIP